MHRSVSAKPMPRMFLTTWGRNLDELCTFIALIAGFTLKSFWVIILALDSGAVMFVHKQAFHRYWYQVLVKTSRQTNSRNARWVRWDLVSHLTLKFIIFRQACYTLAEPHSQGLCLCMLWLGASWQEIELALPSNGRKND